MSRTARLVAAVGVAAAALGFAFLFVPGAAGYVNASNGFVAAVGLLALLQGYRAVNVRRRNDVTEFETPDPEVRPSLPTPGDDLGRNLGVRGRRSWSSRRERIADRLETAAIEAIERTRDCSEADARRALAEGTWTDDPVAAAFFTDDPAAELPLTTRVRLALSMRPSFDRRARHAAHAIADLYGVERR